MTRRPYLIDGTGVCRQPFLWRDLVDTIVDRADRISVGSYMLSTPAQFEQGDGSRMRS